MDDTPVITENPPSPRPPNLTRAGVTGKVPDYAKPHGRTMKVRHASRRQRRHAKRLKKHGLISERASARHGL